jgi:hypothetical protein
MKTEESEYEIDGTLKTQSQAINPKRKHAS